ncbi:MAG: tetratricopeptide repeat protein [Candidatus Aminicenantales bacterium]
MKSWKGMVIPAMLLGWLAASAQAFPQTDEAVRLADQNKEGVVALILYGQDKTELGRGTAFGIAEDLVATSFHLVARAFSAEAVTSKGKKIKIQGVAAVSRPADVVYLKLKGKVQALPLGTSSGLKQGARIFALGSNEAGQIGPSDGAVRNVIEIDPGRSFLEVSLAVPAGFTGGPVFDPDGTAAGMVQVLEQGLICVVPAELFKNLPMDGKVTDLGALGHEDYFAGIEGAFLAGRLASAMNNPAAARRHLEKAVSLDPSLVEGQALLAKACSEQRDYSAAAAAFTRVIELDGGRADAQHGLGNVYIRLQRFQDAIAPLEKAVSLDPARKEAFYDLGIASEETKDFAKAAEAYGKYISLGPENPWSGYLRLGICRMQLNAFPEAVAALEEARKLQPQDVRTNFNLAEAYWKADRLDKAEETLLGLCTINPDGAVTYHGKIIQMYDGAGRYDKALDSAKTIISISPKNELAVYNLGIMYLKLKRYDEAVESFRNAIALKPDYASAIYNIGYSYSLAGRWEEAVAGFRKYAEFAPDDPLGYINVGVGLIKLKQYEAALEPLRKCVALDPKNAAAHYNLAIVYLNLKDNYSAQEVYKLLLDLDPNYAKELKKVLK